MSSAPIHIAEQLNPPHLIGMSIRTRWFTFRRLLEFILIEALAFILFGSVAIFLGTASQDHKGWEALGTICAAGLFLLAAFASVAVWSRNLKLYIGMWIWTFTPIAAALVIDHFKISLFGAEVAQLAGGIALLALAMSFGAVMWAVSELKPAPPQLGSKGSRQH